MPYFKAFFSKSKLCLGLLFFLVQCSSTTQYPYENGPLISKYGSIELDSGVSETEPEVVPDEIDEVLAENSDVLPSNKVEIGTEKDEINESIRHGIPVEINNEVEYWIDFFTGRHREMFQRYLDRGEKYKNMIVSTLKDQGVPTELYYLAMIESGFITTAKSRASAVGLWQFIRGTGRRYGLRIDSYVDERKDPMRATIAAAIYLNDLKNVFDSWYLAMAAYNAGEMRILRAIMKGKSRNFWELARSKHLPRETMHYIPKFLAAYIISSNTSKFGFTINPSPDQPILTAVAVPSPIKLSKIARETKIPYKELALHNPHLTKKMTPPGKSTYTIWMPQGRKEQLLAASDNLKKHVLNIRAPRTHGSRKYHRVRRGDTLASISKRYNLTIRALKRINGIRGSRIYAGTRLKILSSDTQRYKVRRGDNLYTIAKKFQTTVRALKKLNRLRRNRIYAGQILTVKSNG